MRAKGKRRLLADECDFVENLAVNDPLVLTRQGKSESSIAKVLVNVRLGAGDDIDNLTDAMCGIKK